MTAVSATEVQRMRDVISRVVHSLSQRSIEVRQFGSKAFVEFDTRTGKPQCVVLPSLPENCDRELLCAIQGFLDHEVAHLLFTDFEFSGKQNHEVKKDKTLHALTQILEDVRIERAMQKKFEGSSYNLGMVRDFIIQKVLEPDLKELQKTGTGTPSKILSLLLPAALRALDGQKEMAKFMEPLWPLLGPVADVLREFVPKMKGMASTQDVFTVARALKEAMKQPPSSGGGQGDDSDNEGSPEGEPHGDPSSSKSKKGKGPSNDKKKSESDKNKDKKDEKDKSKPDGKDEKQPEGESGDDKGSDGEKKDEADQEDGDAEGNDDGEQDGDEGEADGEVGGGEGEGQEDDGQGDAKEGGSGSDESEGGGDGDSEGSMSASADGAPGGIGGGESTDYSQEREWAEVDPDALRDLDDMASDAISAAIGKMMTASNIYIPYTRDYDYVGPLPKSLTDNPPTPLPELEVHKRASTTAHVVQQEIQKVFRARSASRWQPGLRKGRVNAHSLHRLATGDDRVFRQRVESQTKSVAVSLVCDFSGSMCSQNKMTFACIAAYMFSDILEKVGIANEIVGFTTMGSELARELGISKQLAELNNKRYQTRLEGQRKFAEESAAWHKKPVGPRPAYPQDETYSRYDPICLYTLKGYQDRFTDDKRRNLSMVPLWAHSGLARNNVDGESIFTAGQRLMQRKEARKIMIVMSDGNPAADGDRGGLETHLKTVIGQLTGAGIDLLGLGLCDRSVERFYAKSQVANRAEEIPGAILGLLKHLLN